MVTCDPGAADGRTSTFPWGVPPSSACLTLPRSSAASEPARVTVPPTPGTISPTAPRSAYSAGSNRGTTRSAIRSPSAVELALRSQSRPTPVNTMSLVPFKEQRFSMKRKAYGRDAGLTLRMVFTSFLLGLLYVGFAVVLFYILNAGLVLMLVIVIGLGLFQYYTSDKIALAASGAKIVERDQAPELHDMVERLCAMRDLPKPRIAIVDTDVPNAFATGRNPKHAVVAVTQGLWRRLDPKEIEGVLAHELTHIANRDVLVMTVASFFAMLAAMLTRFGLYAGMFGGWGGGNRDNNNSVPIWLIVMVVSVVTYFLSWILIRTISRYREYAADRGSALITGAPEYLMSALQKIASQITQIPQRDLREVAGMNAFFIIPTNWRQPMLELFMDHPPLEKRLAALAEIARQM